MVKKLQKVLCPVIVSPNNEAKGTKLEDILHLKRVQSDIVGTCSYPGQSASTLKRRREMYEYSSFIEDN